ncbi:MAG: IS3 family transposase [Alphaproteobacteria bacterium]|nr:IS3 family transposase [Alphaproteobacteria bacterium]
MINPRNKKLSVRQQCDLIGINRATYYLKPKGLTQEDLQIIRRMDEIFTEHPYYGTRRMACVLSKEGYKISRKRVRRYYVHLGLEAIYPKMNLSRRNFEHKVYPYLLRDVTIAYPNHVWSADITYIRLREGFVYLVAIIDWYSRKILSWRLSNTLESTFCVEALEEALRLYQKPVIFNTDQGVQFTSKDFVKVLEAHEIAISMDGRGRALGRVENWRACLLDNVSSSRFIKPDVRY